MLILLLVYMSFSRPSMLLLIIVFGMFISSLLIINAQMIEEPHVNISYPDPGQKVKAGSLTIYGTSSDNALRPCYVSALLNDERPYQNVTANGPEGADDYSKWTFTFDPYYALIEEGQNEMVSKIVCLQNDDTNSTAFNKLEVTSPPQSQVDKT
jgi:hypothetical protein